MQNTRWIAFAMLSSLTRSAVHFLPSAGNVTAPYPVSCKLSIFGSGINARSISLDGLRLSQPEGVWLAEIFPELKESDIGLVGLEISMSSTQARVDLGASMCVLEFFSNTQSCRFNPRKLFDDQPIEAACINGVALKDAFHLSSLVIVNACEQNVNPRYELKVMHDQPGKLIQLPSEGIPSKTVQEIELSSAGPRDMFAEVAPIECSYGLLRMQQLLALEAVPPALATFLVYRDVTTRRVVSVSAL